MLNIGISFEIRSLIDRKCFFLFWMIIYMPNIYFCTYQSVDQFEQNKFYVQILCILYWLNFISQSSFLIFILCHFSLFKIWSKIPRAALGHTKTPGSKNIGIWCDKVIGNIVLKSNPASMFIHEKGAAICNKFPKDIQNIIFLQ